MVNISKTSRSLLFYTMLALMSQPAHAMFSYNKDLVKTLTILSIVYAIIGTCLYNTFIRYKPDKPLNPINHYQKLPKEILAKISKYICDDLITYIENTNFPLRHTLQGHTGKVHSANFSPNSKEIIILSSYSTIVMWSVKTEKQIHKLQNQDLFFVARAKFSTDGKKFYFYSFSNNKTKIWDIEKEKIVKTLEGPMTRRYTTTQEYKNRKANFKLILSKNNLIPHVSNFLHLNKNVVEIKDSKTKKTMHFLRGHAGIVWSAKSSPDKKMIITTSKDNTAKIWNAKTLQILHTLPHPNKVSNAKFSPNGKMAVTISNKTANVLNTKTWQILHTTKKHLTRIEKFKFSPDNKMFATSSTWNGIRVLDTETWQKLCTIQNSYIFEFSPNSKQIAAVKNETVQIYDNEWREENLNWLRNNLLPHQAEIIRRAFETNQSGKPFIIGKDSEELTLLSSLSRDRQRFLKAYLDIKISQSL